MPVKLRSFHQLRYQEMKKFKQLVTLQREDGTESKQQLNKSAEDDSTSPRHSTQNTSKVVPIPYAQNEKEKTLEVVAEKDEAVERMLEVIEEDSEADSTKQQPQEEKSKRNGSKEDKSEGEEEQDDDEEEGDDTDNCRLISNHDGPGSPSFRVYCIPSSVKEEDEGSDDTCIFDDGSNHLDDSDERASQQRILSWDDIESLVSTDNSDEVTEANGKKQKKKKYVMGIKGRPFSVRNLLNVKKMYYQSNQFRSISNRNN